MNDYYNYEMSYSEPEGIDPWDAYWFEDGEDETEPEYDYEAEPELQEDFGYFGAMGMWD